MSGCPRGLCRGGIVGVLMASVRSVPRVVPPPRVAALLVLAGLLLAGARPADAQSVDPEAVCRPAGAAVASLWPHRRRAGLIAVLCRHDPLPGWWDSLWIAGPGSAAAEVPLNGTGVVSFAWLDCPGQALAHVVDRTHMGTLTDQLLRVGPGGGVEVVDRARLPRGSLGGLSRERCPG